MRVTGCTFLGRLILSFSFLLSGCGSEPNGGTSGESTTPVPSPETIYELVSSGSTGKLALIAAPANSRKEIYLLNSDGTDLQIITEDVTPDLDYQSLSFSPDKTKIAIRAKESSAASEIHLYIINIDGTGFTKLSSTLSTDGGVLNTGFTSDGAYIIYRADAEEDGVYELYSAKVDGSSTVKLNTDITGTSDIEEFRITSDGAKVVFRGDMDTAGTDELYAISPAGGTATKLNNAIASGGKVYYFSILPDASRVIYRADEDNDGNRELWSVLLDGSGDSDLATGITGDVKGWTSLSTSSTLILRSDEGSVDRLYSKAADGSGSVTDYNSGFGASESYGGFSVSSDDSFVMYRRQTNSGFDLYTLKLSDSSHTSLNVAATAIYSYQMTNDESKVVFTADMGDGVRRLYSVPITGTAETELTGTIVSGGGVGNTSPKLSSNSTYALFKGDLETDALEELYIANTDGSALNKVSPTLADGEYIGSPYGFNNDNTKVFFSVVTGTDSDGVATEQAYVYDIASGQRTLINTLD